MTTAMLYKIAAVGTLDKFKATGFLPLQLDDSKGNYFRVYTIDDMARYKRVYFNGIKCAAFLIDNVEAEKSGFAIIEDKQLYFMISPEENKNLLLSDKILSTVDDQLW